MCSATIGGHYGLLSDAVDQLWANAIAPSTRSAYHTGLLTFRQFVAINNLVAHARDNCYLFPIVTEDLLISFAAHCSAIKKLAYATIKLYLAGVRFHYLQAGLSNPLLDSFGHTFERLHLILRSIKKSQVKSRLVRLPIDYPLLSKLCTILRAGIFGPYTDLLMEAACITAFFGFLRCGEFTVNHSFDPSINLCLSDINFNTEGCTLTLKKSKSDPFRQGVDILLFYTGHSICPAMSLRKYIQARPNLGVPQLQPLFITTDGIPLSRDYFIAKLKTLIKRTGQNESLYSGHSIRIGSATSAANARLEDHLIQTLGRWSSDCYMRYIRTPRQVIRDAQLALITDLC
jgi:hypothetical protein